MSTCIGCILRGVAGYRNRVLKGISNQGISVIAVGTEEARKLLGQDEQVANRMRVIHIKGFTQGQDLMDFLHSLEAFYPLPQPSGLGEKQMMNRIYQRTLGVTGDIIAQCNAAAVWAVRNNKPCIDAEALVMAALLPKASASAA